MPLFLLCLSVQVDITKELRVRHYCDRRCVVQRLRAYLPRNCKPTLLEMDVTGAHGTDAVLLKRVKMLFTL
jgi:hypothetical protein